MFYVIIKISTRKYKHVYDTLEWWHLNSSFAGTLPDLLTGGVFYQNLPKMAKNGRNLTKNGSFFVLKRFKIVWNYIFCNAFTKRHLKTSIDPPTKGI